MKTLGCFFGIHGICGRIVFLCVLIFFSCSHYSQGQEAASTSQSEIRGMVTTKGQPISVRTAEEVYFSDKTKQHGTEFVRDNDLGLLLVANEQGAVSALTRPAFEFASLTHSKGTVLVRYNVYTGESVISYNSVVWTKIKEPNKPAAGLYEVRIIGSYMVDGVDTFTIFRMEKNTGASWYSIDFKWLPYEEPKEE